MRGEEMNQLLKNWKEMTEVKKSLEKFHKVSKICLSTKLYHELYLISGNHLQTDEFVAVNNKGQNVFEDSCKPSNSVSIHTHIYEQTNTDAILQIQTIDNQVISNIKDEVNITYHQMFHEYMQNNKGVIDILQNENDILHYFLDKPRKINGMLLIKNSGLFIWGESLEINNQLANFLEFEFGYMVKLLVLQKQSFII